MHSCYFCEEDNRCYFDGAKVQQKVKLVTGQKFTANIQCPQRSVSIKNAHQSQHPEYQQTLVKTFRSKGNHKVEGHQKQAQDAVENDDQEVVSTYFRIELKQVSDDRQHNVFE